MPGGIPLSGGVQDTSCLRLDRLNGWLFGINDKLVRDEIREKIIASAMAVIPRIEKAGFLEVPDFVEGAGV